MPHSRTTILLYHRVAAVHPDPWGLCVTPEHFEQHLEVLGRHRCERLDRVNTPWRHDPAIVVTFDDGYADNLLVAAPLLKRYGVPATFFITTGGIGSSQEFWWDQLEQIILQGVRSPDVERRAHAGLYELLLPLEDHEQQRVLAGLRAEYFPGSGLRRSHRTLTHAELNELASERLFEIGAHTVTHPLLAAQPREMQQAELRGSKRWLEARLERPIASFSFPYGGTGHYSAETVAVVQEAGFKRACTTNPRRVRGSEPPWEWGRFQVPNVDGGKFEKWLAQCVRSTENKRICRY